MLSNLKAVATSRDDLGMLRWVLLLRQTIPGLAQQERDEFQAVTARFN
ncbi:unannotated protein [freshwater metagenome]